MTEGKFEGRFKKRIRLSNKRGDFTGRWQGIKRQLPIIDVPFVPLIPSSVLRPPLHCLTNWDKAAIFGFTAGNGTRVYNWVRNVSTSPDGVISSSAAFDWSADLGLSKTESGTTNYVAMSLDILGAASLSYFYASFMVQRDVSGATTFFQFQGPGSQVIEVGWTATGAVRFTVIDTLGTTTVNLDSNLLATVGGDATFVAVDLNILTGDMTMVVSAGTKFGWETGNDNNGGTLSGTVTRARLFEDGQSTLRHVHLIGDMPNAMDDVFAESACLFSWTQDQGQTEPGPDSLMIVDDTNFTIWDVNGVEVDQWAHGVTVGTQGCAPAYLPLQDKYAFDKGRYIQTQDQGGTDSAQRYDSGSATQLIHCMVWNPGDQLLYCSQGDAAGTGELDFGYFTNVTDATWTFNSVYTAEAILDFEIDGANGYLKCVNGADVTIRSLADPSIEIATLTTTKATAVAQAPGTGFFAEAKDRVLWQENDSTVPDVWSQQWLAGTLFAPNKQIVDGTNFTYLQPKSLCVINRHLFVLAQLTTGDHIYRFDRDAEGQDNTSATFADLGAVGDTVRGIAPFALGAGAPAAPTDFTASAETSSRIRLDWDASGVTGEVGFEIERSPDGVGSWAAISASPVAADAVTADDTGLTAETHYWYRLRSYATLSSAWVYADDATFGVNTKIISVIPDGASRDILHYTLAGASRTQIEANADITVGSPWPLIWSNVLGRWIFVGLGGNNYTVASCNASGGDQQIEYTFPTSRFIHHWELNPAEDRLYVSTRQQSEFGYFDNLGGTWAWNSISTDNKAAFLSLHMDFGANIMWGVPSHVTSEKTVKAYSIDDLTELDSYDYASAGGEDPQSIAVDRVNRLLWAALNDESIDVFDLDDLASGPTGTHSTGWGAFSSGMFMVYDPDTTLLYIHDVALADDGKVYSIAKGTGLTKGANATELFDEDPTVIYSINLAVF
jgi:hypothetical protein